MKDMKVSLLITLNNRIYHVYNLDMKIVLKPINMVVNNASCSDDSDVV